MTLPIFWVSPFVIARLTKSAEAISWDMRLPRTLQVLAMTKSQVPDESGSYKNLEKRGVLYEIMRGEDYNQ
jgi:hypothetical protein